MEIKRLKKLSPVALTAIALMLVLITAIGANSRHLPLLGFVENKLHDLRIAAFAQRVEEHPGIVILAYDEETLALTRQRSPLDRGILARVLRRIDKAGAVAIGIDILIDQADDPVKDQRLFDTFAAMQTPVRLAWASSERRDGGLRHWQQDYLHTLVANLAGSAVQPARVALRSEADGTIRRTPPLVDAVPPPMAWALASEIDNTTYVPLEYIDFRRDAAGGGWPFLTFPIHLLDEPGGLAADMLTALLTDRIVLISATLDQIDQHSTPLEVIDKHEMPGIGVHAQILAQLLDNRHPWQAGKMQLWLISAIAVIAGLVFGMISMNVVARVGLSILAVVTIFGIAIALQGYAPVSGSMLPLAGITIAAMLAYLLGAVLARAVVSEERKFIRGALAKYVPAGVARELELHPEKLEIGGQRCELSILFSDIAGFTSLCEQLSPEEISIHLNKYLNGMTEIIHNAGGTLDKYIGDAVVAFWGAPLPCEDTRQRSIKCALELDAFAQGFSQRLRQQGINFGHTRIGVHTGYALVGNFGSGERFQYTAIGDTVNTAARIEGANKYLGSRVLISADTVENAAKQSCRPLGALLLKGREQATWVYEATTQMPAEDLQIMEDVMIKLKEGKSDSISDIESLCTRYPDDEALQLLLRRLRENNGNAVFELTGK